MKVLIIKISSMGDIIHTLPAVTDAHNAIPNISFDWVVEKTFSEIPQWHPAVHQVILVKLRTWKKKWRSIHSWKEYYTCTRQLKKSYDFIIDAQGLLKTSLFFTSITNGEKHGLDYSSTTEPISSWFYNKHHYINKNQHAIERIRQLFSHSLKYPLPSCAGQYNIKHLLQPLKQPTQIPYLIFLHSTTTFNKHWPDSHWNQIIQLATDAGYQIRLPFWTPLEKQRVQDWENNYKKKIIVLSQMTLKQIAIQMLAATAIISVDTGLSHLAAALDCPNLTLYGPTDPKLIGTYGKNQIILSSHTKKMKNLSPPQVWETLIQKKLIK